MLIIVLLVESENMDIVLLHKCTMSIATVNIAFMGSYALLEVTLLSVNCIVVCYCIPFSFFWAVSACSCTMQVPIAQQTYLPCSPCHGQDGNRMDNIIFIYHSMQHQAVSLKRPCLILCHHSRMLIQHQITLSFCFKFDLTSSLLTCTY